jgi:hypothetical protein
MRALMQAARDNDDARTSALGFNLRAPGAVAAQH